MAQITYDFLVGLTTVTDDSVQWLRKTSERPPRVSVYDVLSLVTGVDAANCTNVWNRLVEQCPEVLTLSKNFKFPGRGQLILHYKQESSTRCRRAYTRSIFVKNGLVYRGAFIPNNSK